MRRTRARAFFAYLFADRVVTARVVVGRILFAVDEPANTENANAR